MKKPSVLLLVLAFLIILGGCGSNSGAVAIVNGQEIEKDEFDSYFEQVKTYYQMQGVDIESPEMEDFLEEINSWIVEDLIIRSLLMQGAEESEITVTEAEIEEELDSIRLQYVDEESFQQELSYLNMAMEDLRQEVEDSLLIYKFVRSRADEGELEVLEDEIEELYDEYISSSGVELDYDEVRSSLLYELEYHKEQLLTQRLVDELWDNGDIEILL